MMRRLASLLAAAVFLAAPFLAAGADASAENRSYQVSGYNINVNVAPDGSADFREELTYSFSGSFNGILRSVDFSLSGGIDRRMRRFGYPAE
jgi:ABC-type oligopeptide transport system substrate-binding subunit